MKEFKSKVGYGIVIPVLILIIAVTFLPIMNGASGKATTIVIGVMLLVVALTISIFFGTTYKINDKKELLIKCGFLYNSTIDISKIKSIERTRNPISSPAPSLDRIELKYGKWDSVIISPEDKVGFVNELVKINPDIKHNLK